MIFEAWGAEWIGCGLVSIVAAVAAGGLAGFVLAVELIASAHRRRRGGMISELH